jgi:hypothetical protein
MRTLLLFSVLIVGCQSGPISSQSQPELSATLGAACSHNSDCGAGEYCKPGQVDLTANCPGDLFGTCSVDTDCQPGWNWRGWCGCDGKFYPDLCSMAAADVHPLSRAHFCSPF